MMLAWDRKNFRRRDSLSKKKMIQRSSHVVHTFRLIISYAYTAIRQSCLVPIQSVRELLCKSHQSRKDGSRTDNMSFFASFHWNLIVNLPSLLYHCMWYRYIPKTSLYLGQDGANLTKNSMMWVSIKKWCVYYVWWQFILGHQQRSEFDLRTGTGVFKTGFYKGTFHAQTGTIVHSRNLLVLLRPSY